MMGKGDDVEGSWKNMYKNKSLSIYEFSPHFYFYFLYPEIPK